MSLLFLPFHLVKHNNSHDRPSKFNISQKIISTANNYLYRRRKVFSVYHGKSSLKDTWLSKLKNYERSSCQYIFFELGYVDGDEIFTHSPVLDYLEMVGYIDNLKEREYIRGCGFLVFVLIIAIPKGIKYVGMRYGMDTGIEYYAVRNSEAFQHDSAKIFFAEGASGSHTGRHMNGNKESFIVDVKKKTVWNDAEGLAWEEEMQSLYEYQESDRS